MEITTVALTAALNLGLGITLALTMLRVVEQAGSPTAGVVGLLGAALIIAGQAWIGEFATPPLALGEFKLLVLVAALSGVAGLLMTFTGVRPEP